MDPSIRVIQEKPVGFHWDIKTKPSQTSLVLCFAIVITTQEPLNKISHKCKNSHSQSCKLVSYCCQMQKEFSTVNASHVELF